MALARTIIEDALTEIGVYSQGESLSAPDAQMALRRFQMQIDAWNAERLTLATSAREVFTLTGGVSTVTIGEDGTPDWDAARPVWFNAVNYIVLASSPEVEVPMGQMDEDSYAAQSIKDQTSSYPTQFYYEATTPNGTLFFWPTPSQDVEIVLYYPLSMTQPATLTTDVIGPPGYQEAFMYQLAIRLAGPFGRQMPPQLPEFAAAAMARMKRPNTQPGLLGVDAALWPGMGAGYNVLTDQG